MTPNSPLASLCYKDYYDKYFASNPSLAKQFLINLVTDLDYSISSVGRSCGVTRPTAYKALKRKN